MWSPRKPAPLKPATANVGCRTPTKSEAASPATTHQMMTQSTPPRKKVATGPSTPGTPSSAKDQIITSASPNTKAKILNTNHTRGKQGSTKLMFSPPYAKKSASPVPTEPTNLIPPVKASLQRNLALYGSQEQHFDEYDEEDFDPWHFIACLPKMAKKAPRICLPPKTCRTPLTLVLDLDETLVHCSTNPGEMRNPDFKFEVNFNGTLYQVECKKRPGMEEFLEYVHDKFECVIFTASQKVYANALLDIIDPHKKHIKHRLFRDSCVNIDGNYLKDLRVCGRDLSRTLIVDNSPQAFGHHMDNGLPILSWFDNENDTELYKIIPLLEKLARAPDVRPLLARRFALSAKVAAKAPRWDNFQC